MKLPLFQIKYLLALSPFLLSINAAVLVTPAKSSLVTAFNTTSLFSSPLNTSILGAIDPEKFQAMTAYGDISLPPTSVLMNAVNALVELALQGWEDRIDARTFRLDEQRYSDIEIHISPSYDIAGPVLKSGFAVLGLFEVMLQIVSNPAQRFKSINSIFLYDGQEVGQLKVNRTLAATLPSTSTLSALSQNQRGTSDGLLIPSSNTTLSAPAWSDPRLSVSLVRGFQTLTIYEVFYGVFFLLREMAPHASSDQVKDFSLLVNLFPVTAAVHSLDVSFDSSGNPPRTAADPPFFQWEWLIKAIGQLPKTMLDARDLRDIFHFGLKVDGVPVGRGWMLRQQFTQQIDALAK